MIYRFFAQQDCHEVTSHAVRSGLPSASLKYAGFSLAARRTKEGTPGACPPLEKLDSSFLRFLSLALAGQVGAVGALVGLNVFDSALLVSDSIELLACAASMGGSACFACHT